MTNLRVGDEGCTISEVLAIIETTSASAAVQDDWKKFGRVLGTNQVKIKKLHNDLLLDKTSKIDVIEDILVDWRSKKGRNATLVTLLSLCEEQCGWQDVADSLRKIIKSKAVTWNDLDDKTKMDVLQLPVQVLGQTTTLSEIQKSVGSSKMNKVLIRFLKEDFLRRTLDRVLLTLDNDESEKPLPYYVERTLTLQRQLDPEIFKAKCADIFVIQGMQRNQLSSFASPERTDLSGNQVKKISVRFILLECDSDYVLLCKKIQAPIHRIMYEKDNFYWTTTMGSINVVRKYLMSNTEEIPEDVMVTQKLTDFNTRPIAIADSPGMGKTVLLSEISRRVAECYPKRYILKIYFQKLFPFIEYYTEEIFNLPFVKRSLAKCFTCIPLGQEILFELMNCKAAQFEIFLDGFDEIPSSHITRAEQMVKLLSQSDNLRAFITTRTYMRDKLEQTIGVISWNIHPFTISDQKNFFTRYWTNTLDCENTSRLKEFVDDFVQDIQSNDIIGDSKDGNDFAGLPIKCYMLAEVNSAEAQRYITSYLTNTGEPNVMKTVNDLYQKFMTFRFNKVLGTEKASVKQAHWKAAIQLLFPTWVDQLREFLGPADSGSKDVDSNMLMSVGILQDVNPPDFVHRTFAEYLVGEFVVSALLGKCSKKSGTILIQFLFDAVLTSTTISCDLGYSENLRDEFVTVLRYSSLWLLIKEEFEKMAVLYYTDLPVRFFGGSNQKYAQNLIHCWFHFNTNPNTPTYLSLVNTLQYEMKWPLDICKKLLNIPSVQRRSYRHPTIVHFINAFLSHEDASPNFDKIALKFFQFVEQYLYTNVMQSTSATWFYENISTCGEMGYQCILKLLVAFSVYTVDSSDMLDYNWTSAILAATRHDVWLFQTIGQFVVSLFQTSLLQLYFGILEHSEDALTPLHKAVEHGNYHLVEYLISKYGTDITSMSKHLVYYCVKQSILQPMQVIKQKMEMLPFLLQSINKTILDEPLFDVVNERKIKFTALTAPGIHVKLFKHLIELGACTGSSFDATSFIGDVVTRFSTVDLDELVDYLAEKCLLELLFKKNLDGHCGLETVLVNSKLTPESFRKIHDFHKVSFDEYRDTYMSAVVFSKYAPEMVKATVEIFNNVNLADSKNNTILTAAAFCKSLTSIEYLVSVGADVNHFSDIGLSPLMQAIYVNEDFSVDLNVTHECVQVLLEAGADVNARNMFGETLFDTVEFDQPIKVLKKETLDLLIRKSCGKYGWNSQGVIKRRNCVIC